MYYFYVLRNPVGDLYFGSSNDLRRRVREHTRKLHGPWELIYYEAYKAESDARAREERIKHHGQAKAQLKRRIKASLGKS